MKCAATFLVAILSATPLAAQAYGRPPILRDVGIEQHNGASIPLDTRFTDESGRAVTIREYAGKPIILALVYYQCPSLCGLVLSGVGRSTRALPFKAGEEYEVVAVSFNPSETPQLAREKQQSYAEEVPAAAKWHFLTGAESSIRSLADAVGFHYAYDAEKKQYAHPSAITLLTPEGRISRYFYGIEYPARDLKLSLIEASNRRIGSPIDQIQLFCFQYDPASGKYTLTILKTLRLAGIGTVGAIAALLVTMLWRERRPAQ
jgi:protein SCO1